MRSDGRSADGERGTLPCLMPGWMMIPPRLFRKAALSVRCGRGHLSRVNGSQEEQAFRRRRCSGPSASSLRSIPTSPYIPASSGPLHPR